MSREDIASSVVRGQDLKTQIMLNDQAVHQTECLVRDVQSRISVLDPEITHLQTLIDDVQTQKDNAQREHDHLCRLMSDSQFSEVSQHKHCHSLHTRRTKLFAAKFLGESLKLTVRNHTLHQIVKCVRLLQEGYRRSRGASAICKVVNKRYAGRARYYLMKWF